MRGRLFRILLSTLVSLVLLSSCGISAPLEEARSEEPATTEMDDVSRAAGEDNNHLLASDEAIGCLSQGGACETSSSDYDQSSLWVDEEAGEVRRITFADDGSLFLLKVFFHDDLSLLHAKATAMTFRIMTYDAFEAELKEKAAEAGLVDFELSHEALASQEGAGFAEASAEIIGEEHALHRAAAEQGHQSESPDLELVPLSTPSTDGYVWSAHPLTEEQLLALETAASLTASHQVWGAFYLTQPGVGTTFVSTANCTAGYMAMHLTSNAWGCYTGLGTITNPFVLPEITGFVYILPTQFQVHSFNPPFPNGARMFDRNTINGTACNMVANFYCTTH